MAAELALFLVEGPSSSLPEIDDAEGVRERLYRGAVDPIKIPFRSMLNGVLVALDCVAISD